MTGDPELVAAAIDPLVAAEHPGLRVWTARVPGRVGRTPRELRERLALLSDRLRGPEAVTLRTRPVPWAYRVLFRHLGLDPDVTRPPLEALVVDRLLHGGFAPARLPEDALALATLETGVPVWAVDADRTAAAGARARRGRPPRARGRRRDRVAAVRPAAARARAGRATTRAAALRGAGAGGRRTCSSRRRCGRRPPRSIPLTRRHDAPSSSAVGARLLLLAAPAAAAVEARADAALRVRPGEDHAGPEHDLDRGERAQAARRRLDHRLHAEPRPQGRQRPARRRDPPPPRRLAQGPASRCSRPARRRPSSTRRPATAGATRPRTRGT